MIKYELTEHIESRTAIEVGVVHNQAMENEIYLTNWNRTKRAVNIGHNQAMKSKLSELMENRTNREHSRILMSRHPERTTSGQGQIEKWV